MFVLERIRHFATAILRKNILGYPENRYLSHAAQLASGTTSFSPGL